MLRTFIYSLLAIVAFAQAALADDFKAQIKQAEELSKAGQHEAALAAMDSATTAIWLRSPLTISKAFLVTKQATRFGVYEKRPDNIYAKDKNLRVYLELIGYDWQKLDGQFKINLSVDVILKNAKGSSIWSKKEFAVFNHARQNQFKKLYVNLRLGMKTVPPSKYEVEYTMNDKVRKQIAVISLPFEIQ